MFPAVPLTLDVSRRHPVRRLDDHRIVVHGGPQALVVDVRDMSAPRLIPTENCAGAVAVSDDGRFVAIGEKCLDKTPRVVVFAVQTDGDFAEAAVLQNGAQRRFDALDFSSDAALLATVSGSPDFLLTIWNWRGNEVILRSKAFSQEIFTVKFSRRFDRQLTTSGTGHIRFWSLTDTFTGTKLQGSLGKFGKAELSDIADFAELRNGYVVSGTESGDLLLWRECRIQAVVRCAPDVKCHGAAVNFVAAIDDGEKVLTASEDGWIKAWDVERLLSPPTDTNDSTAYVEASSVHARQVRTENEKEARVAGVVVLPDVWVVFLSSGGLVCLDAFDGARRDDAAGMQWLWKCAAGGIVGLVGFESAGCVAAAWGDGTIGLFDIEQQRLLFSRGSFSARATCLARSSPSSDPDRRLVFAGFDDGTVRVLKRCLDGWKLTYVAKTHKVPVVLVLAMAEAAVIVGENGGLFFLRVQDCQLAPIGLSGLSLNDTARPSLDRVTVGCVGTEAARTAYVGTEDGKLFRVRIPDLQTSGDNGYRIDCQIDSLEIGGDKKSGEKQAQLSIVSLESVSSSSHKDWLIVSTKCASDTSVRVLGLSEGVCQSVLTIYFSAPVTTLLTLSSPDTLLLGLEDGSVSECALAFSSNGSCAEWIEKRRLLLHDCTNGGISGLFFSSTHQKLVTASRSGTIFATAFEKKHAGAMVTPTEAETTPLLSQDPSVEVQDIIGRETHSIDEAQLAEARKLAEEHAAQKKKRIRNYIQDMRQQLLDLKRDNSSRPPRTRVPHERFRIDSDLQERAAQASKVRLAEAKQTYAYDLEKHVVALDKLRKRFFEGVERFEETLTGIEAHISVQSYTLRLVDPDLRAPLEESTLTKTTLQEETIVSGSERGEDAGAPPNGGCSASPMGTACGPEARRTRKKRLEDHEKARPGSGDENGRGLEAIHAAMANLGDFKMKTDPDYQPQEIEHPSKKEKELKELEVEIYRRQADFNSKFDSMKESKAALLEEIRRFEVHSRKLRAKAGSAEIDEEVNPSTNWAAAKSPRLKTLAEETRSVLEVAKDFLLHDVVVSGNSTVTNTTEGAATKGQAETGDPGGVVVDEMTSSLHAEHELRKIQRRRSAAVAAFDREVKQLAAEKLALDCDLKQAELVRIVKLKEFGCLKEFHDAEMETERKTDAKLTEKRIITSNIQRCETELRQKQAADDSAKLRQNLQSAFDRLAPESLSQREALLKAFWSKNENRRSETVESDSDCDSDVSDGTGDGERPEDIDDVRRALASVPAMNCRLFVKGLWSEILALKDQRLELEAEQARRTREVDSIKREREIHTSKLKTVESALAGLRTEARRRLSEKQKKLNEIRIAVILRPSQIETTDGNYESAPNIPSLLLSRDRLEDLEQRSQGVEAERQELKHSLQKLKADFKHLNDNRRDNAASLERAEARFREMQLMRFGRAVNLEDVDRARQTEEQRKRLPAGDGETERSLREEMALVVSEIRKTEEQLRVETEKNTELLLRTAEQKSKLLEAEKVAKDCTTESDAVHSEQEGIEQARIQLASIVREQSKTILELREHVLRFKRKDSMIHY